MNTTRGPVEIAIEPIMEAHIAEVADFCAARLLAPDPRYPWLRDAAPEETAAAVTHVFGDTTDGVMPLGLMAHEFAEDIDSRSGATRPAGFFLGNVWRGGQLWLPPNGGHVKYASIAADLRGLGVGRHLCDALIQQSHRTALLAAHGIRALP